MKKILILSFLAVLISLTGFAQEQKKESETSTEDPAKTFSLKISGFVKSDFFYDSRQTVSAREGHFLLWPAPESPDADGNDINAKSNFNFLSIQSRINLTAKGPEAFGAKTTGVIEGDFFGQANDNINLFRLRHAYIKLNWENTELLAGQTWNPFFVTGCFPGTVSFNTGTPLQSFARNPQLRITQKTGSLQWILAALGQRDYTSRGPAGATSAYLSNSGVPDMHFQVQYGSKNEDLNKEFLLGAGIALKTIVPRLVSETNYKVDEKVSGFSSIIFTKVKLDPVTFKLQWRYGENIADLLSISGFAVKDVENLTTDKRSYTPLKNTTIWGEIHTNDPNFQVGLFGGYLKNNGTKEAMSNASNPVYGLGTNIESLVRISPRAVFISNKTKIAFELEYTSAAYGSDYDENYVPDETTSVSNVRALLSAIYSF